MPQTPFLYLTWSITGDKFEHLSPWCLFEARTKHLWLFPVFFYPFIHSFYRVPLTPLRKLPRHRGSGKRVLWCMYPHRPEHRYTNFWSTQQLMPTAFCDSIKNTAFTHLPEERGAMEVSWGGMSRRYLAKGEERLLTRPLPGPLSNSCCQPRAGYFALYPRT